MVMVTDQWEADTGMGNCVSDGGAMLERRVKDGGGGDDDEGRVGRGAGG